MSLDRDMSENLVHKLEFVLTPSAYGGPEAFYANTSGPQTLFENTFDELIALGNQVEASIPDITGLPPPDATSNIINFEQVKFFCKSTAYRTSTAIQNGFLPINLFVDHSTAIGSLSGALSATKDSSVALLWIDAHLDSHDPHSTPSRRAHGMPLSFLTQNPQAFPEYQNLRQVLDLADKGSLFPADRVVHLGCSQISLHKPNFRYYSMDIIGEYGLRDVLNEIEEVLSDFKHVYVSWDIDSIDTKGTGLPPNYGFSKREAAQIANWIDLKLRRKNKLLGLDLAEVMPELDPSGETLELVKDLLLRIFGATYFNNKAGLYKHLGLPAKG
jgi:arginase